MRFIRIKNPYFAANQDAIVYDDAEERTGDLTRTQNDVGMVVRQLDASTRWRLTAVDAQTGEATWAEVLSGTDTPATIGTSNTEGDSTASARANHSHSHGTQTDQTLHAAASASAAGFLSAADFVRVVGVSLSTPVLVPAGSGVVTVQTTGVLLTVKNSARAGRFAVTWNKALSEASTQSGEIEFAVAWLDDDTQTIEQVNADNTASGATPSITVAVHGVNVVLLLNADHTVTLKVTRDGTYPREAMSRYWLEDIFGQSTVPASFASATSSADGSEIAITYDSALDEASVPAVEAFTLHGTAATIASVGISTTTVTLTLTGNVAYDETVTFDYAVPAENPLLADADGGLVAAGSALAVTNAVPPVYQSATTNAAGDEITLTYEGALDETSIPANTDYTIAGDDATVDTVVVDGSTVVLTLTGAIENGDSATISYTAGENPVLSLEGCQVADLTTEAVTNMVPPLFVSATSNNAGDEITVTWEGALDDGETPPAGVAFTLGGTSATVASVALSGTDAVLTLETALVEYGETVTVSYAVPGENPILGACGSPVALLTTEACTNVTPPDFVSAAANADGSTIVITMEAALDEASVPAAEAFALSGTTATIASVGVSGAEVTLTLTGLVAYGETPLVSYAIPGSNKLQENGTSYVCTAFTEESVTNAVPPVFVSGISNALGSEILVTYSAALDEGSVPAIDDFLLNGDDAVVNGVYVSGATVRLTLDGVVEYDDTISLDYTPGVNPLQSVEEYGCAALDDEPLTNAVPPGYSSGATNVGGTEITLTWAGNLNESSTPAASCFDINGDDATVASLVVSGATVVLTLSGTIEFGDTITVDYVVPESNPLQSAEGYGLAALTAAAVTNNVPE